MQLMVLVEDPQAATIRSIVAEATAQLAAHAPAATAAASGAPSGKPAAAVHVAAFAGPPAAEHAAVAAGPLWVSPAPISIKMRLFCLPYAGGVSENVFAR